MSRELSLKEIQNEEKEILKNIINFFEKYNIKYYAYGGTLLGAVRHNGFIPWDDDIDIIVPRPDYDLFLDLVRKGNFKYNNLEVISYELNNSNVLFCKVINKGIIIDCEDQVDKYLWIDIFAVDGLPEEKEKYLNKIVKYREKYYFRKRYLDEKLVDTSKMKSAIKKLAFIPLRFISMKRICNKLDSMCRKYDYNLSKYVCDLVWAKHPGNILKKEWLEKSVQLKFENINVNVFEGYRFYLENRYGKNYMELPSEDKRITHSFRAWSVDDEK